MGNIDVLVVGAGFAGCVIAERSANAGKSVLVVEKREHIAGNAYDEQDSGGVLIHRYGPHIFHTNDRSVAEYLSRFTAWRDYEHRVLSCVGDQLYPMPINRTTINKLYGLTLDEAGIAAYLSRVREPREEFHSSEDVVVSSVGRDLCDKFFRNYTRKQWGLELSQLSPAVAGRIPARVNDDDRYFVDAFQKMPSNGYTAMFRRMLDHPNIRIELGVTHTRIMDKTRPKLVAYTGPIDEYFRQCYGPLAYRSLRFEHEHLPGISQFQPVGTVNYPNAHDYTRITEFKHLTGQVHLGTSIVREYPQASGEPYYPVLTPENQLVYKRYHVLAQAERGVVFLGRLAQYRYYNMDQVVAAALAAAKDLLPTKAAKTADLQ